MNLSGELLDISEMLMALNYLLAEKLRGLAGLHQYLDSSLIFTAETGSYVVPLVLVALFVLNGRSRRDSIFIFTATILGIGLAHFVQQLYVHPRPFEMYSTLLGDATGDSFPSQHASTLFPFSLAILYRGRRKLGLVLLLWAVVNSFSRMVVGYHFPLDILAGFLIGVAAVYALSVYEEYVERFSEFVETVEKRIFSYLG